MQPARRSIPSRKTRPLIGFTRKGGYAAAMRVLCLLFISIIPTFASAADFLCSGDDPAWDLTMEDETAQFRFQRRSELSLMLTTTAQDSDTPQALTYVGRGDSLIAIIEDGICRYGDGDYSATILTQRGQTPVMLLGCCTAQ